MCIRDRYSTNNVAKAIAAVAPGLRIMDNINMGSNPNNLPDMRMRGGATVSYTHLGDYHGSEVG